MKRELVFLDLFAGAGGLSEGFIRAGFKPIAHVEADKAACNTLKTRMIYYWLKSKGRDNEYFSYLKGEMSRSEYYNIVSEHEISLVINSIIGKSTLHNVFCKIDELLDSGKLDLIIGGPPCQAYSLVGRSRDKNRMRGDDRNYLYVFYADFLRRYKPRIFLFENVTGLLSAQSEKGKKYFDNMCSLFRNVGYKTEYRILNANDYGVLQNRKRVFIIGRRKGETGLYPMPDSCKFPDITVNEIFSDLPSLQAGKGTVSPCIIEKYSGKYLYDAGIKNDDVPVTWHISRPHNEQDLEIYRIAVEKWTEKKERLDYNDLPDRLKSHKNRKSFRDRFKVITGDLPFSHTLVAHIAKDGHYYIHPDIRQNRSLTPREAARLQTFPDDYFFESELGKPGRTAAYKQIGNAVPVLLAQKIAEKIMEIL